MAFSKEQLKKFANLSRIEIEDEKLESLKIDSVIEWLDKLQKINTKNINPMITPLEQEPIYRKDIVKDGNIRDLILKNTPDKTANSIGYVSVPKVMDE